MVPFHQKKVRSASIKVDSPLPLHLVDAAEPFDRRRTKISKKTGLSNTKLLQNAFISVSRVECYQNKWMPNEIWVNLIVDVYGNEEPLFKDLVASKVPTSAMFCFTFRSYTRPCRQRRRLLWHLRQVPQCRPNRIETRPSSTLLGMPRSEARNHGRG